MRIDKWLWAARVYKTRGLAAAACCNGQVTIAGKQVKPSREARLDELILAEKGGITHTIKVLGFPPQRVGAPQVREFAEDLTPASEFEKQREAMQQPLFFRPKGMGRPTKRDRRAIGKMKRLF